MDKKMVCAALACGILCAICLFAYMSLLQRQAEADRLRVMEQYGGEQVDALVATKDILPGETLDASNTKLQTWVSNLLPDQAITKTEGTWDEKTTSLILSGEVVSSKRFAGASTKVEIPEGHVALSVPAKDVQTVGGSLSPGNRVDVYAVGTSTSQIGENVLVLATSALSADETTKTKIEWVTLAVKPESAQEYIAASEGLEIYFALPFSGVDDSGAAHASDESQNGNSAVSSKGDSNASSGQEGGRATESELGTKPDASKDSGKHSEISKGEGTAKAEKKTDAAVDEQSESDKTAAQGGKKGDAS
ncbi:MAG: Flp pilus assembly protein CpaB [Coriobacteriia bacterium]|nr:Flp pilus assembly protein CpaB [Coriobacteriia bacterium]